MSETPKHTPGPWKVHGAEVRDCGLGIDVICTMQVSNQMNWLADALLIAAAPEMLEALKALRNACWGGCACADPSEEENAAWDIAEAVIAKAEGRQQ